MDPLIWELRDRLGQSILEISYAYESVVLGDARSIRSVYMGD